MPRILPTEEAPIEYVNLGRSGLRVSRAGLGTMNFGTVPGARCPEPEARRIIDAFLDAGGNLIDTADVYGAGQSEEVVGRAIAAKRETVVLATKGSGPIGEGNNNRGLSRVHLTRALDASLRRLGTDYIDLYQCHNWYPDVPVEETISTLDGFVRAGKVRYVGCSNYTVSAIIESQWAAQRLNAIAFTSLQAHYSLLTREIEAEIVPACERHGLGLLTYSPLAGGLLAGRYTRGQQPAEGTRLRHWLDFPNPAAADWVRATLQPRSFDIVDEVTAVANELQTTAAATAIGWLARQPIIASIITGPRSRKQLEDNLAGFDLQLSDELLQRLERISTPTNHPITGTLSQPPTNG